MKKVIAIGFLMLFSTLSLAGSIPGLPEYYWGYWNLSDFRIEGNTRYCTWAKGYFHQSNMNTPLYYVYEDTIGYNGSPCPKPVEWF
ncbi:hypothetical protein [Entomomonas asaccharolytica]|uniref:Secreted protein n=1 Tax=Entomomonas asaccharolytica TaxID=2785331 RepID=A0A974RX83_9GAMM|nr:hypothetical protein [Entomomonas asaccharolytica]QQP84559.1 hypothetical protein JHT90_09045 [Entomomonas asaccharolytica]